MVYFLRHNCARLLIIVCFSVFFSACSSGGGKGGSSGSGDTTPDTFTLTAPTGVDLTKVAFSTPVVSAPVTITGIDSAAPVSIIGGEYAVGTGAFKTTAGTVTNGQTITVRVQSPTKAEQSATATLSIGTQKATFTVKTDKDTVPPEVAVLFPPPASMTEGQTLFLRGTVKDVHGTLAEGAVTVNGVEAELELNTAGDEGSWNITVDLAPGENTVSVTAVDAAENTNEEESVSSRRVADIAGESFPDNANPFGASINADIGWVDEKPVAYVADDTALKVFKVDLTTGVRTVLAENEGVGAELEFYEPWGIHLGLNEKLYVSDLTKGVIFEVDTETGSRTVLVASNEESLWNRPMGMLMREDQTQQKLYVADNSGKVFSVDLKTLEQALVVNSREGLQPDGQQYSSVFGLGLVPGGEEDILVAARDGLFTIRPGVGQYPLLDVASRISSVADGYEQNTIYYVNNSEDAVYIFDVQTKESTAVAGGVVSGSENQIADIWGISAHSELDYLLIVDRQTGLIAMDHLSKQRVIISKSAVSE